MFQLFSRDTYAVCWFCQVNDLLFFTLYIYRLINVCGHLLPGDLQPSLVLALNFGEILVHGWPCENACFSLFTADCCFSGRLSNVKSLLFFDSVNSLTSCDYGSGSDFINLRKRVFPRPPLPLGFTRNRRNENWRFDVADAVSQACLANSESHSLKRCPSTAMPIRNSCWHLADHQMYYMVCTFV